MLPSCTLLSLYCLDMIIPAPCFSRFGTATFLQPVHLCEIISGHVFVQ